MKTVNKMVILMAWLQGATHEKLKFSKNYLGRDWV